MPKGTTGQKDIVEEKPARPNLNFLLQVRFEDIYFYALLISNFSFFILWKSKKTVSSMKRSRDDNTACNAPTNGSVSNNDASNMKEKKQKIFFKFSQGSSNAIRRPVTIDEFM